MNEWPQINSGFVTLVIATIGFVVAYAKLDSRTSTNARDIDRLDQRQKEAERKHDQLDTRVMQKLEDIQKIVSNIQGQMMIKPTDNGE